MHGWMILCDFAEEINGKLYIMGGGWSRLFKVRPSFSMSIAAKLLVPWDQTNRRSRIVLTLHDGDGRQVLIGDPAQPVRLEGDFEAGRPPGLAPGTEIDMPLVFRFDDLPLDVGRYVWELAVRDETIANVVFEVVAP